MLEEQRACREDVVVFDQTSFSKFVLKGRDALAVLQRLCANEIDVAPGRMVYTAMLNARGGFESDLTVVRLGAARVPHRHRLGADDARLRVDRARHRRRRARGAGRRLVARMSVLSVMGPKARGAARASSARGDLSPAALPFATTREIDVGYARARAARMSYVGGPGYELYVPTDQCVTLYDALWSAGAEFGLRDAGYYTIDALRIEAGRRAWGAELSPDETPWEAGLGYAVKMDKAGAVRRPRGAAREARRRRDASASSCSRSTIRPRFRGAASRS